MNDLNEAGSRLHELDYQLFVSQPTDRGPVNTAVDQFAAPDIIPNRRTVAIMRAWNDGSRVQGIGKVKPQPDGRWVPVTPRGRRHSPFGDVYAAASVLDIWVPIHG